MRYLVVTLFIAACGSPKSPPQAAPPAETAGTHAEAPTAPRAGNSTATVAAAPIAVTPPPAASPPQDLAQFLPPSLAGLPRNKLGQYQPPAYASFVPANIVKLYNDCGVVAAADATYEKEHVFLIDTGTAVNALCVFGYEHTMGAKPIDEAAVPQGAGYRRPGHTFAWRGRYYLRVEGSNQSSGGGKNALALTAAILAELPNPSTPDPALVVLKTLPMIGRIPSSEQYLPYGVYGFNSLPRGFSADYGCGDYGISIAHLGLPKGVSAKELLARAVKEALANGYTEQPYHLREGAIRLDKIAKPTIYLVAVGEQAAAIEADGELTSCEHVPRELVRVLQ